MNDRVALITGGARGIGRAIAARLSRDGADVLIADLDIDTARTTASEITAASSPAARVEAIGADCAEPGAVAGVIEAALVRFARLDIFIANAGITVNAVGPGLIATDLTRSLTEDPDASRSYLRQIPAGRFGTPDDVAGAVAFLVSPDAAWITGHLLVVDGGQTLGTPFPSSSS